VNCASGFFGEIYTVTVWVSIQNNLGVLTGFNKSRRLVLGDVIAFLRMKRCHQSTAQSTGTTWHRMSIQGTLAKFLKYRSLCKIL